MKRKHTDDTAHALMTINFALTEVGASIADMSMKGQFRFIQEAAEVSAECLSWIDWAMTKSMDNRDIEKDAKTFTEIIAKPSGVWRVFDLSDGRSKLSMNSDGEIRFLPGASRRMVKELETMKKIAYGD